MTNTFIIPDEIQSNKIIAKYYQIYTQLKKELFFRDYNAGERFYSLRALREIYSVDMQTIQSAVDLLMNDGLLYKKPASGIYVNGKEKRNTALVMGNVWFCLLGQEKNNPYYSSLLTALQNSASKRKLNVIIDRNADLKEFKSWFKPETGDALILTGKVDSEILKYLADIKFQRYCVIGNYKLPDQVPNVHPDTKSAVFKAMEIASGKNKRKVAIIAGAKSRVTTQNIIAGVKSASDAGLVEYTSGIFDLSEDGHAAMQKLEKNDFDCVIVTEPAFFGLARYVFENNIKCPENMFIIRHGNNDEYNLYNDIVGLSMRSNKKMIIDKVFEMLFGNGQKQVEVDIEIDSSCPK